MRQRCEANMPWFSVKWLTSALFLPALRHSDDQEIVDCGWRQVGVWECDRMLIEISYTLFICKKEIFYSEGRMQGREHLLKMHKTLHTHFVSYNLHILGWDPPPLCLWNCLNALWHRFNKVLEPFPGYCSPLTWQSHTLAADLLVAHSWCESALLE